MCQSREEGEGQRERQRGWEGRGRDREGHGQRDMKTDIEKGGVIKHNKSTQKKT